MGKSWVVWVALVASAGSGCSNSDDVDGGKMGDAADGVEDGSRTPGSGANDAEGVPCEVASIVSETCTGCHGAKPLYGAPMPLMTFDDFHAPAKSNPERKVYEVVAERINLTDGARMPPLPNAMLSEAQLALVNEWLDAGASGGGDSCAIEESDAAQAPGSAGSGADATSAADFKGEVSLTPLEWEDPDVVCYEFRAHDASSKDEPFAIGAETDAYYNFTFHAPWDGMHYARSYAPLIDNPEVVHHWLFYKDSRQLADDGTIAPSIGAHPGGQLVHGWAPGAVPAYYAENIATEMPGDVSYTLELHYWSEDPDAVDATGVEVCVTPNAPEHVAAISWLGTDLINGTTASGVCDPTSEERIRLIAGLPHMHKKGAHVTLEHMKADGETDMLIDAPFDFNSQISYDLGVWVEPGDTLKTTCTYSEPATFGEGTGDEMCYIFGLHYPKLALTNGNLLFSTIHGPNTCLN